MAETISPEESFYGSKELRWYQIAARNEAIEVLNSGVTRVLIVLPTGGGKTLTIASSLSHKDMRKALGVTHNNPLRVLFAAHKHRLLTQAESTFLTENNVDLIPHSIFSDLPQDVIDSGWDVTVLDEAHHESCNSFQLQLEQLGEKPIIGLTATPDRSDGHLIKFEEIINPISREQAVEEGFLARTYLNSFVDTTKRVKTEPVCDIIDRYGREMGQTMIFMKTRAEVRAVTQHLAMRGYAAVAILDQTEKHLDALLDGFSAREFQFIVNCNKINEGVDVSGCSDVILGRQFGSYPQLNQVIGRAARPDCECNVWELVNPLSGYNLDTTVVVGVPERHRLIYKSSGAWVEQEFDYNANPLK